MGAGKSTIARAAGRRLGWRVEDIDERIEARERRSVASIFAQNGEAYFGSFERQVLGELLPAAHVIVATGRRNVRRAGTTALLMLSDGAVAWAGRAAGTGPEARSQATAGARLAADRTAMERAYQRRQLAVRRSGTSASTRPAPSRKSVELLLEWIGF
jgi:shikimate kinase